MYPKDIRGAVAGGLAKLRNFTITTGALSDPDQGLSPSDLDRTDVLIWWGRHRHDEVPDATVERIVRRVREGGMGIVFLNSASNSRPFKALLGGAAGGKDDSGGGKPQTVHVALPQHPIARGVRDFTLPGESRRQELSGFPAPDSVVFETLGSSAENPVGVGICWTVGKGRVFYFGLGDEETPVYTRPDVRRILRNAALWTARDEAGIWEDCDPAAPAARATHEPPLALILRDVDYGGTDITKPGEVKKAFRFVKAGSGPVKTYPLASFGLIKDLTAGWYPAGDATGVEPDRRKLWVVEAKFNKQNKPPLASGAVTEFDPGDRPFGLWVSTAGFTNPVEYVDTDDTRNAAIKRFGGKPVHKARVYAAVRSDYTPVPNAYIIGWEYSTNDDFQDIVTIVENVRLAG